MITNVLHYSETELHEIFPFLFIFQNIKHFYLSCFIFYSLYPPSPDVISGCKLYWMKSGLRPIVKVNCLPSAPLCPTPHPGFAGGLSSAFFPPKWISISFHFSLFAFPPPFPLCSAALRSINRTLLKSKYKSDALQRNKHTHIWDLTYLTSILTAERVCVCCAVTIFHQRPDSKNINQMIIKAGAINTLNTLNTHTHTQRQWCKWK